MSLSFKITTSSAPAHGPSFLAQWIAEVLCADEADRDAAADAAVGAEAVFAGQLACVARLFLELAGIPVFDLPEVVSIAAEPARAGNLVIELRFLESGLIARNAYLHAIRFAAAKCELLARTPVSDAAKENLFAEIEQQIVAPAQRTLLFGKSTMQILRGAHRLGIPFMHLGAGVYQFGWGSKARRMERSMGDRDSAIAKRFVASKAIAAGLMRMAGLPAPVHLVVSAVGELSGAAARLGFPLVVKPADGGRGEGVAVDIDNAQVLASAFEAARLVSPTGQVIVERQVAGVCHRLFIANGKLLYAVKRLPMSVEGDARHSVAELIDRARAKEGRLPPWRRSPVPVLDEAALHAMRQAGWHSDSVPGAGVLVPLRRIESTQWGGVDEDVTARLHPENLAVALRAAQIVGLDIAGVDMISPDVAVPWFDNSAIINEVNIGPLLGGGEISRRHIPDFFRDFIEGDGNIPVETFTGDQAWEAARRRQGDYVQRGLRCFMTSAGHTLDQDGKPVVMRLTRLADRERALLCRADVDALLIVEEQPVPSGAYVAP